MYINKYKILHHFLNLTPTTKNPTVKISDLPVLLMHTITSHRFPIVQNFHCQEGFEYGLKISSPLIPSHLTMCGWPYMYLYVVENCFSSLSVMFYPIYIIDHEHCLHYYIFKCVDFDNYVVNDLQNPNSGVQHLKATSSSSFPKPSIVCC